MRDDALLHLTVHYLDGLRTSERLLLFDMFDSVDSLRSAGRDLIERIIRRPIRSRLFSLEASYRRAEHDCLALTADGIGYTFYWDTDYPALLREIHDPPFLIFHRSTIRFSALTSLMPWIAVVGTRYPTGYARKKAYEFGTQLAGIGIPVVSGLAYGIDEAVHRGVVESGGTAIGVLGSGIDCVYPAANRRLAARMISGAGCVMSEYGPGTEARRFRFPARNRIIAGICRGTVVIEAPAKSGALITADFALEDGRDLFVHRAGMTGANSRGVANLARDGAQVIESGGDILREWNIASRSEAMLATKMHEMRN